MFKWFKSKPRLPEPTGKYIDMTSLYWGHNLSFDVEPTVGDPRWEAAIWYGSGVAVGDKIIWKIDNSNDATSLITEVRHTGNVWDMYFIKGVVTYINEDPL